MGGVRPVVVAAVVALLAGALALLYVDRRDDPEPWELVGIQEVAVAEDRESIFVLADTYQSDSCREHRVIADRESTEWTVRLEARRTSEWCTAEGCFWDATEVSLASAEVMARVEAGASGGCPPVYVLDLDEPVPPGVTVVADRPSS